LWNFSNLPQLNKPINARKHGPRIATTSVRNRFFHSDRSGHRKPIANAITNPQKHPLPFVAKQPVPNFLIFVHDLTPKNGEQGNAREPR
jgi:hypothetical protein